MNPFLIACLSSWVVLHAAGAATASRPNFLVLLCDDLGWGDLACYGHPRIRTPHLDGLAKQGVRFTSCYSAAPVCSPSRAGLLTGRNLARAGIYDWIPDISESSRAGLASRHLVHLRKGEVTLPRLLQQAGYATALAGKWHCNAAVGELLAALDRLRLTENTVVFFSSDNGPETLHRYAGAQHSYGSPGPLRGMKLWTTEGGCRVPGILRWPGRVQAGQVSDEPVSSLDLLPTFCALGRAAVPRGLKLDGADLRPVFNGEPVKRDQPLFWVYFRALNDQRAALRDGPWKLLAKLDHGKLPGLVNVTEATAPGARQAALTDFSLYRLTDDPGEARDLSAEEPAKLQELSAKLETLYRELTATMHVWPDTE